MNHHRDRDVPESMLEQAGLKCTATIDTKVARNKRVIRQCGGRLRGKHLKACGVRLDKYSRHPRTDVNAGCHVSIWFTLFRGHGIGQDQKGAGTASRAHDREREGEGRRTFRFVSARMARRGAACFH